MCLNRRFKTEKEAINALKEMVKSENVDPEKINVLEVDVSKEKWEVRGIPWSKIALQLEYQTKHF